MVQIMLETSPPLTAAEIAKQKGVRVYTIAVGRQGMVRQPVGILPDGSYYYANVKSDMDPATLKKYCEGYGRLVLCSIIEERIEKYISRY